MNGTTVRQFTIVRTASVLLLTALFACQTGPATTGQLTSATAPSDTKTALPVSDIPESSFIGGLCIVNDSHVYCGDTPETIPTVDAANRLRQEKLDLLLPQFELDDVVATLTICDMSQPTKWRLAQVVPGQSSFTELARGIGDACGIPPSRLILSGMASFGSVQHSADSMYLVTGRLESLSQSTGGQTRTISSYEITFDITIAVLGGLALIGTATAVAGSLNPFAIAGWAAGGLTWTDHVYKTVQKYQEYKGQGSGSETTPPDQGSTEKPNGNSTGKPDSGSGDTPTDGGGDAGDGGATPTNSYPNPEDSGVDAARAFLEECEMTNWASYECQQILEYFKGCRPIDETRVFPEEGQTCDNEPADPEVTAALFRQRCEEVLMPNPDGPDVCDPAAPRVQIIETPDFPQPPECSPEGQPGEPGDCYEAGVIFGPLVRSFDPGERISGYPAAALTFGGDQYVIVGGFD